MHKPISFKLKLFTLIEAYTFLREKNYAVENNHLIVKRRLDLETHQK